jgi:hypothetical protein
MKEVEISKLGDYELIHLFMAQIDLLIAYHNGEGIVFTDLFFYELTQNGQELKKRMQAGEIVLATEANLMAEQLEQQMAENSRLRMQLYCTA